MPKLCLKCQKNQIPNRINIDGQTYNLCNRKYCLECSPFKKHNTSQLHLPKTSFKTYDKMSIEERKKYNKEIYDYQKTKRWKLKKDLVTEKGGKCEKCGYNKNLAALVFHHIDPSKKLFELDARSLISKSIESIKKEAEKCQLLCSNCHQEIHHPSAKFKEP